MRIVALAASLALAALAIGPAYAQSTAAPAPAPIPAPRITAPANVFAAPYSGSGWYLGLEAGGGTGSVNVGNIPGVNSASLTTTQGLIGGIVGYSSDMSNGARYWFAEADLGWNNFNGNTQGFALGGPFTGQLLVGAGAPASQVLNMLPTFGLTAPTLPQVPGATQTNPHLYLAAGVDISDVSAAYQQASHTAWQFSPMVALGIEAQLSTGGTIGARLEDVLQTDSVCVGAICAKQSNLVRAKVLYKF
ncbi:MAG TPA: hypothetical protein VKX28_26785 [Xanthobacteraceae bacterium]|nr:hypothetical protein [Xanthobacteraceae bacterium]